MEDGKGRGGEAVCRVEGRGEEGLIGMREVCGKKGFSSLASVMFGKRSEQETGGGQETDDLVVSTSTGRRPLARDFCGDSFAIAPDKRLWE